MKRLWVHFNEWWMILLLACFTTGIIGAAKLQGALKWSSIILAAAVVVFVVFQLILSIYYERKRVESHIKERNER